jgi:hypothetical protein
MQSELCTEIVATVDRTEKIAGEIAEVAGGDSDGSKSGKRSCLRDHLDKLLGEEQPAVLVESAKTRQRSKLLPSSTCRKVLMLQTLKTRKSCANNRISILWPGTGEVGTTHGKESGNAEITTVI